MADLDYRRPTPEVELRDRMQALVGAVEVELLALARAQQVVDPDDLLLYRALSRIAANLRAAVEAACAQPVFAPKPFEHEG